MDEKRGAAYAALALRLSLGLFFILHVYRKLAVIGFDSWWSGLAQSRCADWTLCYTLAAEFDDAMLLIPGIYARYVALLKVPVLVAVTRHWAIRKGLWFTARGAEFPLARSLMLVAQSAARRWCFCAARAGAPRGSGDGGAYSARPTGASGGLKGFFTS